MAKNRSEENKERFEELVNQHPEVWDHFVEWTEFFLASGLEKMSASTVWDIVRSSFKSKGSDIAIPQNCAPWAGRRYVAMYPDKEHAFGFRTLRSATKPARGKDFDLNKRCPGISTQQAVAQLYS